MKINRWVKTAFYADPDSWVLGETMRDTEEKLLERKLELVERLNAIRADLARGLAADSEEQAIQLENLEVLQEIQRLANEELKSIENELAERFGAK